MGLNVLVVEGNRACRRAMQAALANLVVIDVVEAVGTGQEALGQSAYGRFDIIVLDADLPDMLGRTLLLTIKLAQPDLQVIAMVGERDLNDATVEDLRSSGAWDVIARPSARGIDELQTTIRALLCSLWDTRPREVKHRGWTGDTQRRRKPAPQPRRITLPTRRVSPDYDFWATVIAVSTGGPMALGELVPKLPATYALPILVVQHMPPFFTATLARDLDLRSSLRVVEAREGDVLAGGTVYLAPGGVHITVKRVGDVPRIALNTGPPVNSCRPSADVLFRSLGGIRDEAGVLAVVMTGMGNDGCEGVRFLKTGKCHCLTQSAASCVVYGMPRAVKDAGLSDESVPLQGLARRLVDLSGSTLPLRG